MKRFFTLAAYVLLIMAFFIVIVTATSVGTLPGIAITLSLLLMDLATWNSKSTLIYALAGVFTAPVLALHTWIQHRLSSNLQKEPNTNSSIAAKNCIVKSIETEEEDKLAYPQLFSLARTKNFDADGNKKNYSANFSNKL